MPTTIERGLPLVKHIISLLRARCPKSGPTAPQGAGRAALDTLESKLMVEIPPTLREFLSFDYTFASFDHIGSRPVKWHAKGRFGGNPSAPRPRMTSARKLAEARTEFGWTDSRIRTKLLRLPNRPRHPWSALYLGEARRDGELLIMGVDHEDTLVKIYPRYTAFDLYLAEQTGLLDLRESDRLDDLESHLALNPELGSHEELDDNDTEY